MKADDLSRIVLGIRRATCAECRAGRPYLPPSPAGLTHEAEPGERPVFCECPGDETVRGLVSVVEMEVSRALRADREEAANLVARVEPRLNPGIVAALVRPEDAARAGIAAAVAVLKGRASGNLIEAGTQIVVGPEAASDGNLPTA